VANKQFQAFSEAIVAFWQDAPENVVSLQVAEVPDWFGKAIQVDLNARP
jgi:hypothetical protein